jgi:16S rRNA (guanine966-N2)-methyltransferase
LPLLFPLLEKRLNPDGMVYAESEKPLELGEDWRIWREGRAGRVFYYLLTRGT